MPRQVLIEVLAAEVTLTDDTRLGIEWAIRSGTLRPCNSPTRRRAGRRRLAAARSRLIPLGGALGALAWPGLNVFTFAAGQVPRRAQRAGQREQGQRRCRTRPS